MLDREKVRTYIDRMQDWRAQYLIQRCAYWLGHPNGPVRAPKHADNIQRGPYGYEVAFGANKFLVQKAAIDCCKAVLEYPNDHVPNIAALNSLLTRLVRRAVSNHADEEYPTPYPVDSGNIMHFGTQGINVAEFINALFNSIGTVT
jgi:hypothetical protein